MKKLVYIGFAFQHHKGTHAGYHQICNVCHYDNIIDVQRYHDSYTRQPHNVIDRIIRSVKWRILGTPVIPWFIFRVLWIVMTEDLVTFHFIYGENLHFGLFKYIKRKNTKIVCTLHQPLQWFINHHWENRLKHIDKVILVANNEIEGFKALTERDNVVFIPHGIDTDFYRPERNIRKRLMILTVGNWFRDYSFADKVYQHLLQDVENLEVSVVASADSTKCLTSHPRVRVYSGISDTQLRDLYLQSSIVFLPLVRYTANNSLLEAAACGCNIVIASNSQDNSYLPVEMINLCQLELEKTIEMIKRSWSQSFNYPLAKYVEENFSWKVVGRKVEEELLNT